MLPLAPMKNSISITQSLPDEAATKAFAAKVAHAINKGAIIYLHGPLGAGKTTFTRGFLSAFNYHDKVKSPTYALVEPYQFGDQFIFHFDFYRLENPDELEHIGIKEYFFSNAICLIEWPEKGQPLLPSSDLDCYIEFVDKERSIRIKAHSLKGEMILQKLKEQ